MATSGKIGDMPLSYPEVTQYFKRLQFSLEADDKVALGKAVLLASCGQSAFALIETLLAPLDVSSADVTFDQIRDAVQVHFQPRRILHYERHRLHSMSQQHDSVITYVQLLKDQANRCDFGDLRDGLILSHFIFGLSSQDVREKLLSAPDLSLDAAVQQALLHESVAAAACASETAVSAVLSSGRVETPPFSATHRYARKQKSQPTCDSCGGDNHRRSDCKFRRAICRLCGKQGHISTVCRSVSSNALVSANDKSETNSNTSPDSVVLAMSPGTGNLWWESCSIGKTVVCFLVDTGSQVTVLPRSLAIQTGLRVGPAPSQVLRAFGGSLVKIFGKISDAEVNCRGKICSGAILVTADGTKPILGMDFLPSLQLVKECAPLSQHSSGFTASFRLRSNASTEGMCYPARSLPFSMKVMVEVELKRLLSAGIIYPVINPSVSAPIVPVVKQAGASRPIRICGDYSQTLNRLIDRDSYTLPRIEEILHKITGATVYSVLDLKDAYLQVNLAEESQKLTCISTHLGHFAFTKLQFGISAAPLIFQEAIDKTLEGIPYVSAYQDDIIIGTPTQELHDSTLRLVKHRLSTHHFTVNEDKCQISQSEVKFLGYKLHDGKLLPHPDRTAAFAQLPRPTNKEQLRSLLGTLRHYGCFCPNFSSVAHPLYELLKRDVRWKWQASHSNAVLALLDSISKGSIVCYDINKPLFLTSDASKDGLGYVLSHDRDQKEIVWVGSRVLTAAETNYSNVEREALAIVEATKYFHRFIAGRKFVLITDHAPLKHIFDQSFVSDRVSARLQRWAITLRAYDYTIQYAKGENMHLADSLSRLPSAHAKTLVPEVHMVELNSLQGIYGGESLLRDIIKTQDREIVQLKAYIMNGWPKYCSRDMLPYSQSRDEYTVQSGLIYRGARIVPPKQLRSRILHILHEGHPGIVRMIRQARQYFWWPGIDSCVNSHVQRCFTCQTNARRSTNAKLSSWTEATEFFERVHMDVAYFCGKPYLLLVDAHSKWVDVQLLNDLTSLSTISALRSIFKFVGLPVCIVSDNGTNFVSQEFTSFLRDNYIRHVTTPPGHHQSNGQVERVIQEFKLFLSKSNVVSTTSTTDRQRRTIEFCLSHNTSPMSNGAVPNAFVFLKPLRTRLSVQCTEKDAICHPRPVYVRVENRNPAPSELIDRVGSNTALDSRGRLVHDSDIAERPCESDEKVSLSEDSNHPGAEDEPQQLERSPECRRSTRVRRVPQRYGYPED